MTNVYDVPPEDLIRETAQKLKNMGELKPPAWTAFIKTGMHKERPPLTQDWWYIRAAAVLRSVYRLGPIGVAKLRVKYGGKKNRGHKPDAFFRGSGSIPRHILQQLEKAQLLKQVKDGVHKGRVVTPKGKALLDKTATELKKAMAKPTLVRKEAVTKKMPAEEGALSKKPKQEVLKEARKEMIPKKNE